MELREIGIDDVYPDEKNPRKDFGDIAALAESCMLNALNPGEPVNPIVVVEDGGIYRIVDGERRYKAMCKNKLARCHAVVCDDMDEANAMVAMVATDDKRPLTDVERSRGVQQMLLLGVDPERVERAGRMPKGAAAKLRRARAAVDDAGDDMTIDPHAGHRRVRGARRGRRRSTKRERLPRGGMAARRRESRSGSGCSATSAAPRSSAHARTRESRSRRSACTARMGGRGART